MSKFFGIANKTLPISTIRVGKRHRRDHGDIGALAASIADLGLLQPIAVDPSGRLVAGERRLRAVRQLGWQTVPVHVVTGLDDALRMLQAERDENLERLPFAPSEAVALGRRLEQLELAAAHQRQQEGRRRGGKIGGRGRPKANGDRSCVNDAQPKQKQRVSGRVGAAVGLSASTYERAKAVVDAADAEPGNKELQSLRRRMDSSGRVNSAYRRLQVLRHQERLTSEPPPELPRGPFAVIVADPPWAFDSRDPARRGVPEYPTLSVDEIKALPVPDVMARNCAVWLWVPVAMLPDGLAVLESWGLQYRTTCVWVKDRVGVGSWLRNQVEVCLLGTQGKPAVMLSGQSNALFAARREAGRKPDEFLKLIEQVYPGAKLELFARQKRFGWTAYGDQVGLFEATNTNGI
jgi:N6-adenosine-specific RNA methylase IME4